MEDQPVVELAGGRLTRLGVGVLLRAGGQPHEVRDRLRGVVPEEVDRDVAVVGVQDGFLCHVAAPFSQSDRVVAASHPPRPGKVLQTAGTTPGVRCRPAPARHRLQAPAVRWAEISDPIACAHNGGNVKRKNRVDAARSKTPSVVETVTVRFSSGS